MKISQAYLRVLATVAAQSNDPSTQVGCLVLDMNNKGSVAGYGWNTFPKNNKYAFPWDNQKYWRVVHAEVRGIFDCIKRNGIPSDAMMICTHLPCNECMKLIIEAGIQTVVFLNWRTTSKLGKSFDRYHIEAVLLAEKYGVGLVKLSEDGEVRAARSCPEYQELVNGRKE